MCCRRARGRAGSRVMSAGLSKRADEDVSRHQNRAFWRPTAFETLIACVVAAAWLLAIVVMIRHEQSGVLMSIVYLALALLGIAVSWLLLWPLLRFWLRP